jgi:hypothetical protein
VWILEEEILFLLKADALSACSHLQTFVVANFLYPSVLDHLRATDRMEFASKPSLTPQERIELIRAELESIKASTAKNKWEMLAMEMQDIKDDLSDEIQAGLKDAANLMGDLGKRLCKLELQVEELTTALGKISEATAEASSKKGH